MANFEEALTYGTKNLGSVFIGGILLVVSFLLIPLFLVQGYLVRIAENTMKKDENMPNWENFGDMLVKGLFVFIIGVAYFIIPVIVFLLLGGISLISLLTMNPAGIMAAIGGLLFAFLIAGILFIILGFMYIFGILRYVETGNLASAFGFGDIISRISKKFGEFIVAYIIMLGICIITAIALGLLSAILIGIVLFPFAVFYIMIVFYRLFAKIYSET